jgi:flagellar biosynthesis GTPase FlhF
MEMEMNNGIFNASVEINELMLRTLTGASKNLVIRCVEELSKIYGFPIEEALVHLSLDTMKSNVKTMAKRTAKEQPIVKEKPVKMPKEVKSKIPMPFSSLDSSAANCNGIKFNHGLFTQCPGDKLEEGIYCKSCKQEADENPSGTPICGTLKDRMECDLMEYDKDSKGRKPVHYLKVLRKLNINPDDAKEEAGKLNYTINNVHLVEPAEKISKGRPKKTEPSMEAAEDLFEAIASPEPEPVEVIASKPKLSAEEKAEKEELLKQQREAKKLELEAKKLAEKAEKEAAKIAEKAEKEKAKLAEKAEKEMAKLAEKAEKEAAKIAEKTKKIEEKAEKEKSKVSEKVNKRSNPSSPVAATTDDESKTETQKVKVCPVEVEGVKYFVTVDGTAYDPVSKKPVGTYDKSNHRITPLLEYSDDEEEEEEYEEEDN